jgi:hypothetical protein
LAWNDKSNIMSTVDDSSLLGLLRHRFNLVQRSSESRIGFHTRVHLSHNRLQYQRTLIRAKS